MDLPLPIIPLLEVVTAVLLMGGMDLGEVDHLLLQLHLGESLVDDQVILLMHGSMASLAGSAEDLETSSQPIVQECMLATYWIKASN